MSQYLAKVRDTLRQPDEWAIEKVPRAYNIRANTLAGIAALLPIKKAIMLPIHFQANPSIVESPVCNAIEES